MNMKKNLLVAIGLLASSAAFADVETINAEIASDSSIYMGADIGTARTHGAGISQPSLMTPFGTGIAVIPVGFNGSAVSANSTPVSIFVGHQYGKHLATEVAYTDLGSVSGAGWKVGRSAITASVLGILPVTDHASVYAKLGVARTTAHAYGASFGWADSVTDRSNGATYGLGAQYDVTHNIAVRASWDHFSLGGGSTSPISQVAPSIHFSQASSTVDAYKIGALYRF